jgi:hypothetical protein
MAAFEFVQRVPVAFAPLSHRLVAARILLSDRDQICAPEERRHALWEKRVGGSDKREVTRYKQRFGT